MEKYLEIFSSSFINYAQYVWRDITSPSLNSYFYYLIFISLIVWGLELMFPWRRNQSLIRKDFWQDGFYMFFNFFIFSLIGYNALSDVFVSLIDAFFKSISIENKVLIEISSWPVVLRYFFFFVLIDFIEWGVHVLQHRIAWMWKFHKVHHSVTEMGFAAHLRYHWMEVIFYKTALYFPFTFIGFGINEVFLLHAFTILIGHLNHANLRWNYGWLGYILNSPHMHIWHHAKKLPKEYAHGANFGITLSVWDYLFKTAYEPSSGKDIELGFEDIEHFPSSFIGQMKEPFVTRGRD